MISKSSYMFRQVIQFVIYITLQLMFAQSVIAVPYGRCFIYVGVFLLLFKQRTNLLLQLLLAFALGLVIDVFYNTLGIHASASVLVVYLKYFLSRIMLPTRSPSARKPSLINMGFVNFSMFILVLLFVHHATVFFLEAWSSGLFLLFLQRAFLSTLITYLLIFTMEALSVFFINNKSS
jgi:hypothetical protein